jgi:hypothetical protein
MSSVAAGIEGWTWMLMLQIAEPARQTASLAATDDADFSRVWSRPMEVATPVWIGEEDAERWDGLS